MSRQARVVAPGFPHHITARGNHGELTFTEPDDRIVYMKLLATQSKRYRVKIQAYCLMTNHVHLIAIPEKKDSLSGFMSTVQRPYAEYLNLKLQQHGHLWEERYYSCVLDNPHFWAAVRYVENNPVRAGMVKSPDSYPWSSAKVHAGPGSNPLLDPTFPPEGVVGDWLAWLRKPNSEQELAITKATHTCKAAGSTEFLKDMEEITGRSLVPKKAGRPSGPEHDEAQN